MAFYRHFISFTIVVFLVTHSNAYKKLKGRIDSMELRLNYLEVRVNTDSMQTRSEFYSLEESVFSLNSSLAALNEKVHAVSDNDGVNMLENVLLKKASKRTETEESLSEKDQQALILGFMSEKKWLKDKVRTMEVLFDTLKQTTQESVDAIQIELKDQETAFEQLTAKLKDVERRQDDLERKFQSNENQVQELKKENAKFREDMFEMFVTLNASLNDRLHEKPPCPDGWLLFEKRCYYYKENIEKTFPSARDYCGTFNAYIADFENNPESEFIYSLTGEVNTWAGISDEIKEGSWISERTSELISYTNWRPGDPDGGRGQNCVMLGFRIADSWHQWIDRGCENKYHFVCKKDASNSK